MTLEAATEIQKLLNLKDRLLSHLADFEVIDVIRGDVVTGKNGHPFTWNAQSREIRYIREGLEREIKSIDEQITSL